MCDLCLQQLGGRQRVNQRVVGTVLKENRGMLVLGEQLGFSIRHHPEDDDLRWLELPLQAAPAA